MDSIDVDFVLKMFYVLVIFRFDSLSKKKKNKLYINKYRLYDKVCAPVQPLLKILQRRHSLNLVD